ncbi:UNKNOWN [Stylonychia lemnae]|uniref:Transmembrane protein n=1 Tax=Stylonychia lemnae TaxID=5949 RepID=A0A078AU93_STYLE|nr:UNKNOWN [Stylonychia lemnae]|eukprot:CDW85561.1 UNKNOWN [Stylonychia lemnae]
MKPQPKKPQPKQAAQAQAKPQESIQPQKKEEPPKQEPQKVVQIVEPPKPKENLKLNELKKQWLQFQLYSDVKDAIEEQFNVTKIPLKDSIRDGKIEIKDQIEDFDKIIKKQKAKLRKHEFEEGLIHMRLRHNLLSQHEYEERKKFISVNLDLIPEKDKEFQEKLGIREYFMNKNSVLLHSTIEKSQPLSNAHKLSLDLTKPLIPTTQLLGIGSLTERGKSSNDKHRNKEPKLFNFKTLEEKQKHDEFINKIRDQDKERRKLKKQLEQLHQKAEKEKVEKLNFEKQKEHEKQEQDKKKRFLDIQEALSKKEKERIEQKQQQDQALTKLFNHQPLHIKMEFQYKNEVELPLLEQKKKKLEEIRQFFKQPLDKKDISNHQKKYESEAEAKQREREKKKQQKLREFYERQQDIYESKYVEMDQKQKEEEEERMRERKLVKERMNEYFESIKDTIKIRDDNSAKKLKKSDEQQSDLFKIKTLKHGAQSARGLPNLRSSLVSGMQDIHWKSEHTLLQEEKVKKNQEKEKVRQEVLSKDYLKEVLSHQKGKLRESAAEQDIGRYMNDQKMSDRDRFDLVQLKAKQYEDKAKLDEQLLMLDDNDPKAVQKAIEQGQCNEISDLYLSESLLNVEVDNITQTIGIQYIYNFHLLWFDHNATNIEFVNNFKDGLIFNRVYNKTILAFSNETSHQLYQKQEDGKFILNGTMLQNYTDIDLMLIELPEEIRPLYNLSAVNITNLTMLISSEDMQILKQNITNAKNRTFTTRFIYFTYMNCPKVSFYKFVIGCFTFAYLILFIMFLLRQMRSFNRDPSILQRCVPIMPFLKMIYCGLNFIHWMSCPWLQKDEAMNFIKSFRVTMATLFQTSLCMFFLLNVYGFKISRQSLTQDHIKKLLIIMSVQYFVDSLFTLSGFIPETRIAVSFILNIFSLYMIQFALKNAKLNFDALNLRLAQVQRQQSLDYLAQTIIQKKKLISYATLTMIGYYSYEIYIHGVKNFVFQDENYFQQLNTNIIHEFVDQFCVYCLGLIVTLANQSNNQLGGGMIDISYGNFNHNIREVPQDINYECNIKLDNEFDPESDEKIIKKLDDKTPIILIYPDCENYEFKIGYKEKPKESRVRNAVVVESEVNDSSIVSESGELNNDVRLVMDFSN